MSVTLGNFFSSNGRTVLGGLGGSGLDTETLIKNLTDARSAPKLKLEDKVTLNNNKITAYDKLRTLMATLKDAANFLRNPPGVGNAADNVFKYRSANLATNTSIAASTYLSMAVEPGTTIQSHSISSITSLARAKKQTSPSFAIASASTSAVTAGSTAGFFKAGTVSINGEDLTLEAGDSLTEVASKFNAIKDSTGISASVIQAGTNDFRLVFSANESGSANDFNLNVGSSTVPTDVDGVLSMLGRTNLATNGTFNTDITGWTDASAGLADIAHDGSGAMVLNGTGSPDIAYAQQAITTEIGRTYTIRLNASDITSDAAIRVGTVSDVGDSGNYDLANQAITADGVQTVTFTATSTTSYLTISSDTNTSPITIDDVSVVENINPFSTTQAASDAVFTMDGIEITRSTNTITDVLAGVTINLKAETPALTTVNVDIEADKELPKSGVVNFINAFNALRIFASEQTQTNADGTFKDDSYLANDALLKNTLSSISNELARIVNTGGDFTTLSDIGVTYSDLPKSEDNPLTRNVLTINEEKFASALASSFDTVEALFGFSFTSSNNNMQVYSRTNALNTTSFSVSVNPGTSYTAVVDGETYQLDATSLGNSGYTLTGKAGTPLEGLVLIYGATTAGTSNITVTQGIGDRLYNLANNLLDEQQGALKNQVDSMQSTISRYETEMARIDEQVEKFRDSLLKKFGALESTLSSVNTLLNSLDAQQAARNNASN